MANEFKIKKGLIVTGASGGTVVDIQGSQGQLFSVTDDLSGSIFAVSDISGVPILDVNSNGTIQFSDLGAGTLVTDANGNISVSSGGGAGGPYLPLTGGTLTGHLIMGSAGAGTYSNELKFTNSGYQAGIDYQNNGNLRLIDRSSSRVGAYINVLDGKIAAYNTGNVITTLLNTNGNSYINGGNVGIGATDPGAKLEVSYTNTGIGAIVGNTTHNSQLQIYTAAAGKNSEIWFGDAGDADVGKIDYDHANDSMSFFIGATKRLSFDSAGTMLLGDTATAYQTIFFDPTPSTVYGNGTLQIQPTTSPGSGIAQFTTNFADRVGGGTTKHNVRVGGTVTATDFIGGSGAYLPLSAGSGSSLTDNLYINDVDQNNVNRYGNLQSEVGFTRSPVTGNPNQWFKVVELNGSPKRLKFSIIATGDNTNSYDNFLISTSGYGMYMHIEKLPGGKYNTSKLLSVAVINPNNGGSVEIWIKLGPVSSGTGATYVACTSDVLASATILASATTTAPTLTANDTQLDISNDNRLYATLQASRGATFGAKVGIGTNSPAAMLTVAGDSTISGNVGIGTTSTSYALDVDAGGTGDAQGDSTTAAIFRAGRQNVWFQNQRTAAGNDWNDNTFKIIAKIDTTSHQSINFVNDTSYNEHIDIYTGNQLFNTRFNANGDVGIGQPTPLNSLDVYRATGDASIRIQAETATASTILKFRNSNADADITVDYTTSNQARMVFTTDNSSGYAPVLSLEANRDTLMYGRVGIGTTTPVETLTVPGGEGAMLGFKRFYSDTGTVPAGVGSAYTLTANLNTEQGTTLTSQYQYKFYLTTTGTGTYNSSVYIVYRNSADTAWDVHRVSSTGLTSNHPELTVSGTSALIYNDHPNAYGVSYRVETSYSGQAKTSPQIFGSDYMWTRDNTDLYYMDGDVGIGVSNPVFKLDVAGAIQTTGSLRITTANPGVIFKETDITDKNWDIQVNNGNLKFYEVNDARSVFNEHVTFEAGGNVGIGATNPRDALEIVGNLRFVNGEDHLMIKPNSDIQGADFIVGDGISATDTPVMSLNGLYGGQVTIQTQGSAVADKTVLDVQGTQGQLFSVTDDLSGDIFSVADISGVPIMNVNSNGTSYFDGNVGIGTTSPIAKLNVNGGIKIEGTNTLSFGGTGSVPAWAINSIGNDLIIDDQATTVGDVLFTNAGSVGIGTSTPGDKLHVNGTVRSQAPTTSDWGFIGFNSAGTASSGVWFDNGSGDILLRRSDNSLQTRIRSAGSSYINGGSLGLGTTSPDTKLDVISGTNNGIRISATDTTSNWRDINIRSYVSQAQANALPSGSAIYTTNPTSQSETAFSKYGGLVLQGRDDGNSSFAIRLGNGNGYATRMFMGATGVTTFSNTVTATNFILSSDERKKTKIKDLTCDNINVNWKSFELKEDEGEYRTGVIAQELEQSHPEFVKTDDEGFKSVKYIDLLIAKIAELEARLEKLEK